MAVTIEDIEKKEFQFKSNGYDPYEVDRYLDEICDEMVELHDKISSLTVELQRAREDARNAAATVQPIAQPVVHQETGKPIATTQETLENILFSAQRVSDETIAKAKERADEIISEAENKAGSMLGDMEQEQSALKEKIETMRAAAISYRSRFMDLLGEQKALLEADQELFDEAKK